jgi:uncharacterized short protein YbdD (DUF466 family)
MAHNPFHGLMQPGQRPSMQFQQLNQAYQSDPRRILGQTLMGQGASSAPVRTPLQGLGRLSSALVGAYLQRKAGDAQTARETEMTNQIMGMLPANATPQQRAFAAANPVAFAQLAGQAQFAPTTSSELVNLGGFTGVQTTQTSPLGPTSTSIGQLVQPRAVTDVRTAAQKDAEAMGLVVGSPEYNEYVRNATLPKADTTAVNVNTGREFTPEQKKVGEARATRIDKNYFEPAAKASETITNIDQALSILEQNPNVSGLGAEAILDLKSAVGGIVNAFGVDPKALGIDIDKITNQQVFRSIINKLVLDQTSKLKGALSNKELDFSGKATAQLGTTAEANKVILAFQKQAALKVQILSDEASDYFSENETYGRGKMNGKSYSSVDQYLNEFKKNNEVFGPALIDEFSTEAEVKAYRRLRGSALTDPEIEAMIAKLESLQIS